MIERHPEIVYVIAGRTHPDVARREGEQYRLMLERRVLELDLSEHVEFDDRFLSIDELSDLLAATDVFVTPYRNREQIASGALTFAIAAGCGIVSTPYWYAEDMLATGAGRLVPFDDPARLAEAVCGYVDEPETLVAARAEARRIGVLARLAVGRRGDGHGAARGERARATAEAAGRHRPSARRACAPITCSRSSTTWASCSTRTGSSPIATPATASTTSRGWPSSRSRSRGASDEQTWTSILYRALAFLHAAEGQGGMRNFMGYDRRWLDEPHLGDHVGRSVWALGEILATAWIPAVVEPSRAACSRRLVSSLDRRGVAAHGCVHGARARTPRPRPARSAGPAPARAPRRPARRRLPAQRLRRLALVRGRAQLRQRAASAGAHSAAAARSAATT